MDRETVRKKRLNLLPLLPSNLFLSLEYTFNKEWLEIRADSYLEYQTFADFSPLSASCSFVFSHCPPSSPPLSNSLLVSVGGICTSCRAGDWSLKKLNSTQDQRRRLYSRFSLSLSPSPSPNFFFFFFFPPPTFSHPLSPACRLLGGNLVSPSLQLLSLCHF